MSVQRQFVQLGGGLDTESSVLSVKPGFVREAWNFEQDVDGGYRRVSGYERFDGQPSPSTAYESEVATRRAAILAVPGSGEIRGIFVFAGVVYAFRNTADGTAKKLFKSTSSGWVEVTTPALQPGGFLEYSIYNFGSKLAVYGADGVNKGFEFNGTTYTEITTGMAVDKPNSVCAHQNHLFFSFGESIQHSGIGTPFDWTALAGAGEIQVGAVVTNMLPQPGQAGQGALAVSTEQSLQVLYGTSAANWSLVNLQSEVGAKLRSMQNIGVAFMLSEMGVTIIGQSQDYGNFAHSVVSQKVKTWIRRFGKNLTCSTVHHSKNQYRLFFGDRALFITVSGRNVLGIMPIDIGKRVTCCTTTFDDRFYFGSDDGFVYQGESGNSFDGADIFSLLALPYNHAGSLRTRKRYRRILVELTADSVIEMSVRYSFSFGDQGIGDSALGIESSEPSEWDVGQWDTSYWDGGMTVPVVPVGIDGTGENINIVMTHRSSEVPSFAVRSLTFEYTPRRGER